MFQYWPGLGRETNILCHQATRDLKRQWPGTIYAVTPTFLPDGSVVSSRPPRVRRMVPQAPGLQDVEDRQTWRPGGRVAGNSDRDDPGAQGHGSCRGDRVHKHALPALVPNPGSGAPEAGAHLQGKDQPGADREGRPPDRGGGLPQQVRRGVDPEREAGSGQRSSPRAGGFSCGKARSPERRRPASSPLSSPKSSGSGRAPYIVETMRKVGPGPSPGRRPDRGGDDRMDGRPGLPTDIELLGFVRDIAKVYAEGDALLFPFLEEGGPSATRLRRTLCRRWAAGA